MNPTYVIYYEIAPVLKATFDAARETSQRWTEADVSRWWGQSDPPLVSVSPIDKLVCQAALRRRILAIPVTQ
jgi:hypothetical protein